MARSFVGGDEGAIVNQISAAQARWLARHTIQYNAPLRGRPRRISQGTTRLGKGNMRIRADRRAPAWIFLIAICAVPAIIAPAAAQQPPHTAPANKPADGAKGAVAQAGRDIKQGAKDAAREVSKAFSEARDKLRTTRQERRRDEVKDVRDKWGALLAKPAVREELKLHARRVARLDYIESLSDDLDMDPIQNRAKRAIDLEDDRHDRRMAALKAKGGEP